MVTLLVKNDLIQITLDRLNEIFNFEHTLIITRTDDYDPKDGEYPCDEGYYYFLFDVCVYLHPEEAKEIIDNLFENTGKYFCD